MRAFNRKLAGTVSALLLAVFSIFILSANSTVFATEDMPRLVDMADLLSDREESDLSGMLDEISERQKVDVAVAAVASMDGKTAAVYANDFYDSVGYGFGDRRDGILLLVSMDEREWYMLTSGFGVTAVSDAGREYISEIFLNDLSMGDYAAAFTRFAELCDDFITQAKNGEPYDIDNFPKEPFEAAFSLAAAFGIAFIISLIVTGVMKGKLKTVHSQFAADNYMKQDSIRLTKKNDLFLYSHVDRKKIEENNSSNHQNRSGGSQTHTTSSGAERGGGGGKF